MSQSTVKKIPNNYFDGMPVTGFHKIVFFIIMMAYFCEQMDNWNFGFIAPDGTTIYLELFHRWHANQLMQRLDQLDEGCEWPLLIGVDRAIAAKPEFQERLDSSPAFQKAGFLYRDFPTIDKLLSKLEQFRG